MIKTGILKINVFGMIQSWIITESKRHTWIMITNDTGKIISWKKYKYIGWWLDDQNRKIF
jgi:hypothetical protein